jgi:hypothetical protein
LDKLAKLVMPQTALFQAARKMMSMVEDLTQAYPIVLLLAVTVR